MTLTLSPKVKQKRKKMLAIIQATHNRIRTLRRLKVALEMLPNYPRFNYKLLTLQKLAKLSGNSPSWFYKQPFIDITAFRERKFNAQKSMELIKCLEEEISVQEERLIIYQVKK
jgi:hypothetical protein